jgi:hypothetical protein
MTGDNATSNDTQTTSMSELDTNAFKEENRVRCFTHTLNLACRSILKPFSAREKKKKGADAGDGDTEGDTDSIPDPESDPVSFDGAFMDGEGEAEEEEEEEAEDVDGDEGTMAQDEDEEVGLDGEGSWMERSSRPLTRRQKRSKSRLTKYVLVLKSIYYSLPGRSGSSPSLLFILRRSSYRHGTKSAASASSRTV